MQPLSNLPNAVPALRFTMLEKKNGRKKNTVTIMISVDGMGTVFPRNLKLEGIMN